MAIRGVFSSIDISSTGLSAQRKRMTAIAENIANVGTTRTEEGGPYRRRMPLFYEEMEGTRVFHNPSDYIRKTELDYTHRNHLNPRFSYLEDTRFSGVRYGEKRDDSVPEFEYDPSHPDANEFGYVAKPKINIITEMVEMIAATRNYEANASAIEAAKGMSRKALEI